MQSTNSSFRNASGPSIHDDGVARSIPEAVQSEIDDLVACAETFVGDAADDAVVMPTPALGCKAAPKYMHGMIRGQQAYLTTNLLDHRSMTLTQPQMIWTLGRHQGAGIMVKDRTMSRRHASIMYLREEQAFYLLDLNSMNGCYVNGIRVEQQRLQDGDLLRIGNTECFFFISSQHENLAPLHPQVHATFLSAFSKATNTQDALVAVGSPDRDSLSEPL